MSASNPDLETVRQIACRLIREVEWEVTRRAVTDGQKLGYNENTMFDLLLEWLEAGRPLTELAQGEPPDPADLAYTMCDAAAGGLYVKFALGWGRIRLISFHVSKHFRGN